MLPVSIYPTHFYVSHSFLDISLISRLAYIIYDPHARPYTGPYREPRPRPYRGPYRGPYTGPHARPYRGPYTGPYPRPHNLQILCLSIQ